MRFAKASAFVAVALVATSMAGCGSKVAGQAGVAMAADAVPPASAPSNGKPAPAPSRSPGPPVHINVDTNGPGPKFPAAIASGNDTQPLNSSVILTNSWGTADGKTAVTVDAGASQADPSNGILMILRQQAGGQQSVEILTVPGSGAVRISSAPLGVSVETSAQTGNISFSTASGATGILHLGNDTVTMNNALSVR